MKSHFPQYVLAAERLDMSHAVELRLPFLDHELFDKTKYLPASLLYKEGLNKYLLRTIAKNDVCPEVLAKLKQPFVSPPSTLGQNNPLFTLICDLITSQEFKDIPFFNHQYIIDLIPKVREINDLERAKYDPLFYYLASLIVLQRRYKLN
jgi:asparagine synthase (glutamine-hydrolysing)